MIIKKGTEINTIDGYIVFDGYNGSGLFFGEKYDFDDKHIETVRLTEADIKSYMKEWDGKAPSYIGWESETE